MVHAHIGLETIVTVNSFTISTDFCCIGEHLLKSLRSLLSISTFISLVCNTYNLLAAV